jgi:hypothetical protein
MFMNNRGFKRMNSVKTKNAIGQAVSAMLSLAVLLLAASCAGTGGAVSSAAISAQAARTADNQRIADWKDRSIGEIAAPLWLLPAAKGDWGIFRETWNTDPSTILKLGASQGQNLNAAQTIADVQYAARIANQLKQRVLAKAAISLAQSEFDVVQDAATKTMVDIAGQNRLTDFWQKLEITDSNGRVTTTYNYYVVYSCAPDVWSQLVAKYLFDITGTLQDTKTQKTMASMFAEIDAETKREQAKTDAQFKAELTAQYAAIETPMTTTTQFEAYKSGDDAQIAAASTTSADKDYIAALSALANQ